tara:strand:- start:1262 stop:1513 length:252 start_codon:yes stop_codon:yes gene_type:complete
VKTIIHINRNILQQNEKHNKCKPICRVEVNGKTWYGSRVDIKGPSTMIYSPDKPRTCGAKLWIETDSEVVIHDKVTFKQLKNQ